MRGRKVSWKSTEKPPKKTFINLEALAFFSPYHGSLSWNQGRVRAASSETREGRRGYHNWEGIALLGVG
ncbi:hypothetical protein JTE90_013116 [Oedothorax gibbosus]|uniref:Uncharacterized protein n=1 Tax=Oedothorax gibbosus TaxID=931172 RepID=A0AAV6U4C8_9ARAC|nr:hypothetical protein JTE90_013116 [Oedothorax gibbosus]